MTKSSLMDVIEMAATRFGNRPLYQASDATRAELRALDEAARRNGKDSEPVVDKK
jgi:hypothetical protein